MGQQGTRYILGIDLGVISVGWAAIEIDAEGPRGILATGVRSWDLSNANLEDVERGREEPPSQLRRQARQLRRQLFRRAQRLRRTYRVLQKMMLFPSGLWSSTARDNYLRQLDAQAKTWLKQNLPALANNGQLDHTLVYRLRAAALDVPLPPELLGRVFFHLAQRRGYVTNRRSSRSDDERGVVEAAISQLTQDIKAAGARTLGEFLAQLNPHEQRIRGRYTSRRMFQEEFELIWQAQQPHYPDILTEQNRDLLFKAIFFQRPLKSQARLIGRCPLETALRRLSNGQLETIYPHRRAPMASLEAQRIRYMQRINDLEFIDPEKNRRVLTQQEREQLYRLAETQEDLSFTEIKRFLGIPTRGKGPGWTCNLEEGGEKKIPGNRTATRIRKVLGDESWEALGEQKQKLLVDTIIGYVRPEALVRHLQTAWGFDAARAEALARIELEDGYHSFSRRAIRKLLPLLAQGMRLNAAIQRVYGGTRLVTGVHNTLPPVRRVMTSVRNPILIRALTELRKVINHLVARFGKPEVIRVELARELKRNRKQRQKLVKRMRQQEDRRSQAAKEILRQFGRTATARDIEKYLLAEECNWTCPYTGREITLEALLGDHPQFDVEHIWPFHRSLDDSFLNKTLCYHEENRNRKRGNTPYEAYAADPQRWHDILTRVKHFQGVLARQKLERFQAEQIPPDFAQRQLSDTRWISKAAADYLGYLYGGRIDPSGQQRVFTVTGGLTALVRQAWNLNSILGGGLEKERGDHRHHAIDAIVIALTDSALVQQLSRAAQRFSGVFSRARLQIDLPWPTFLEDVRARIQQIVVSYRPNRRLSGPLHDQTNYAPPTPDGRTKVRKPLSELSSSEVAQIVDPVVRQLVQAKLVALNTTNPREVFTNEANLPRLCGKNGTSCLIKSVRIWKSDKVIPIGKGERTRYVVPGNNHHIEIYAVLDSQGREARWSGKIVSLFEALQRKKLGQPVVCRDHGPNTRFKFSLAKSDYIEWTNEDGHKQILRVIGISNNHLEFRLHFDARPITDIRKEGQRIRATYSRLQQRKARKVTVTPLGEILPAND